MTYMLRVVTAGKQEDTMFATAEEAWKALRSCKNLAILFESGEMIGYNERADYVYC